MAFQPIQTFEDLEPRKPLPEPYLTVNVNTTGYLGGSLLELLGNPQYLEVEYDAVTNKLRLRAADSGAKVKFRNFPLPKIVCKAMTNQNHHKPYSQRYHVKQRDDGWFYTGSRLTRQNTTTV